MFLRARNRLCTRRGGFEIVHIAQSLSQSLARQFLHLKIALKLS